MIKKEAAIESCSITQVLYKEGILDCSLSTFLAKNVSGDFIKQ